MSRRRGRSASSLLMVFVTALVLAAPATSNVLEGNHVILEYGTPDGPRARVTFNKNRAAREALKIETFLAGVEGSKLSIFVDRDPIPVLVHTFAGSECRFENDVNHCTIMLGGRTAAYGRLLRGFRVGLAARLQVETGGVMAMSPVTELKGFMRATRDLGS